MRQLIVGTMVACQTLWLIRLTTALSANPSLIDNQWAYQRSQLEQTLLNSEGQHLVVVRYHPEHNLHHEWVFNSYDPARSRIVWARWDENLNEQLIHDYPNRHRWILDVHSVKTERDAVETQEIIGRDWYRLAPWGDNAIQPGSLAKNAF
ncbi:MAG: hypothetical protein FJ308_14610 [Planctomycetes bacterium]|nr:hypothetical protein [Planctomycetota bacterium]